MPGPSFRTSEGSQALFLNLDMHREISRCQDPADAGYGKHPPGALLQPCRRHSEAARRSAEAMAALGAASGLPLPPPLDITSGGGRGPSAAAAAAGRHFDGRGLGLTRAGGGFAAGFGAGGSGGLSARPLGSGLSRGAVRAAECDPDYEPPSTRCVLQCTQADTAAW